MSYHYAKIVLENIVRDSAGVWWVFGHNMSGFGQIVVAGDNPEDHEEEYHETGYPADSFYDGVQMLISENFVIESELDNDPFWRYLVEKERARKHISGLELLK